VSNSVRQSPDNGQVTFSINLGPVPTTLECPGNQVVVLACIEFADKKASFETIALRRNAPAPPVRSRWVRSRAAQGGDDDSNVRVTDNAHSRGRPGCPNTMPHNPFRFRLLM